MCEKHNRILTCQQSHGQEGAEVPATSEVLPLTDTTNQTAATTTDTKDKEAKPAANRAPRERRERGPPADGIPSKNKVMVANLPYDLSEEKVSTPAMLHIFTANLFYSSRNSLPHMSHPLPRSPYVPFPASW